MLGVVISGQQYVRYSSIGLSVQNLSTECYVPNNRSADQRKIAQKLGGKSPLYQGAPVLKRIIGGTKASDVRFTDGRCHIQRVESQGDFY